MLFGFSPVRIMVLAYRSSNEFYWKYELQHGLSVLWDTGGKKG